MRQPVSEAGILFTKVVVESVGIRYSCDYCYKDISAIVRIQCAVCGTRKKASSPEGGSTHQEASLEEVDLCVECFAAGVEFGQHKKDHAYRILRPLEFAVYCADWRADEELLLLEAVESNGIGNWSDVAEQLGTRTPDECCEHYTRIYLGREAPQTLDAEAIERSRTTLKGQTKIKRPKFMTSEEALIAQPTPQSVPSNHEIAGFMPLRGEFEVEIENDAEVAIKDMQFTNEDSEAERQLKFAMLEIYAGVLERRAARHVFIVEHGLSELKKHQSVDKMRSREEKELYGLLKPFARFMRVDDFQRMLDGLAREEELRRQIAQLQDLRRHGIRSFEEVTAFESERKHLELYLKGGASVVPQTMVTTTGNLLKTSVTGAGTNTTLIKEPYPLPTPLRKSSTTPAAPMPATITIPRTTLLHEQPQQAMNHASNGSAAGIGPVNNGGRKASTPLNISHAEGVELLSEKERHLCSILRLYPRLYLSIKDTLIREYLKYGGLKRAQARAAVKIDVNKTSKLYDFFIAAGWIKPPASGE